MAIRSSSVPVDYSAADEQARLAEQIAPSSKRGMGNVLVKYVGPKSNLMNFENLVEVQPGSNMYINTKTGELYLFKS